MSIKQLYDSRLGDDRFNTSYPLHPKDWAGYRVEGELPFDDVVDLCFYVHIPFCQRLCQFCEYTRMVCPSTDVQKLYVQALAKDVNNFIDKHKNLTLHGFDIGGGTPTALCDNSFEELMALFLSVKERMSLSEDFEPSIEATFATMSEQKTKLISLSGIRRVSLGVQSSSDDVLSTNSRELIDQGEMEDTIHMLHSNGIAKVNLDFMYGLKGQSMNTLMHDISVIERLVPEQVTLYELRTNMIKESSHTSPQERFDMYSSLYEALTALGYYAHFGQNTFSKNDTDRGVSSYLRHRMTEGMAYKGFGLSAQSMTNKGVSYNMGKNSHALAKMIGNYSYPAKYTYQLPPQEIAAKYVAIAAYSGTFSWSRYITLLGCSYCSEHDKTLLFCIEEGLLSQEGDILRITPKGFLNYGAVFSLFYPN